MQPHDFTAARADRRKVEAALRVQRGAMTLEEQAAVPVEDRPMIFSDRRVHYLDTDVLTEAKARIRYCIETFDRVAISYSGGKDSHAVMCLVRMVMDDMGLAAKPLDVVFQDEELIPDDVLEHVASLRSQPDRYTLHYVAIPLKSTFFCLGEHIPYVQWDNNREWIRPKPDYAITHLHPNDEPIGQSEIQPFLIQRLGWKGRIVMFNGLRAQESLKRFRSCTLVKNRLNYIMRDAASKNTWFVKPIYDWSTHDIFRFFYDHDIQYCKIYDTEMMAGTSDAELRVSTPLHEKSYKYMARLRSMYPLFHQQLVATFPGLAAHERYWKDFDRYGTLDRYPKSFAGIIQFVEDTVTNPKNKALAMKAIRQARTSKENNKRIGKFADEATGRCYGYPILHVFQTIVRGVYLDGTIPLHSNPDARMIAYERQAESDAS